MDWYVIFVKTGKEDVVKDWLNIQFDSKALYTLIPKRKLMEKRKGKFYHVLKKLFPGYIFINTNMDLNKYTTIMKIPDIIKILNNGTSYYSKVNDSEMHIILNLVKESTIIDYSKIYTENSKIFVKSGPLYGMEGIIKRIDKHKSRARILLNFMGENKFIDVGIELIEKLD
ncbi:antiterminator LoaP [Clostridium beijerinckii]|uniref:Transcriptional antiterminator NusG n=1 Tax=Clostridium beijerinckii TaxID=1520 RepID=A0AAE5H434_CLOBE|nr:antiterminator LoaP [Clostridium beijerinckii]ALB45643.1 antiterminator LoaP [Clostridium beijerinckii NRRL B-598]NSB14149.1 transcriptional antiterminator NusG [Clostridium beijerinckii]OOM30501.1 hypothetical protein CLOBE_16150 [Clostridium beijerinckii]